MSGRAIERTNLQTAVTKEILLRIVERRYPIGSKLPPERQMAEDLVVSRPTLRQALALLQSIGVLSVRHGSGNYVNDPQTIDMPESLRADILGLDTDTLGDLLVAREAIEVTAAGFAAGRRTQSQLNEMQKLQVVMAEHMFDTTQFVEANARFHELIAEAGGNQFLLEEARRLTARLRLYMVATTYVAHRHRQTIAQHQRIIDALRQRDEAAAKRAVRAHLRSVVNQSETGQKN
jgi:GntR family transcriptional repressor for pyruvate dehydrogenase complex